MVGGDVPETCKYFFCLDFARDSGPSTQLFLAFWILSGRHYRWSMDLDDCGLAMTHLYWTTAGHG
jgi:hypothetical protein